MLQSRLGSHCRGSSFGEAVCHRGSRRLKSFSRLLRKDSTSCTITSWLERASLAVSSRSGWPQVQQARSDLDRRNHIGGNAYDHYNEDGILVHKYGPHIFHTNSADVFEYLSQFTKWRPYEHRVLASVDGKLVPIPINRTRSTNCTVWNLN